MRARPRTLWTSMRHRAGAKEAGERMRNALLVAPSPRRKSVSEREWLRAERQRLAKELERASGKTRFWQFRRRRARKRLRTQLERRDLELQRAQDALAFSGPFTRAFKGIMPQRDRTMLAQIARRRLLAAQEAEQKAAAERERVNEEARGAWSAKVVTPDG